MGVRWPGWCVGMQAMEAAATRQALKRHRRLATRPHRGDRRAIAGS